MSSIMSIIASVHICYLLSDMHHGVEVIGKAYNISSY
uniref:Uncharacterized protein n=1 Tax=Arundo donax TaxID=35708 RepID=A0A0A9E0I6_ARUDO